jgi:outer membrane protein TolC
MPRKTAYLLTLLLLLCPVPLRAVTLSALEQHIEASPEVMPALAGLEAAIAARDTTVARNGLHALASGGYSVNNEPVSVGSTDRIHYNQVFGSLGLSLPILGSWAIQRSNTLRAEARVFSARQQLAAQEEASLDALRKAYIVRWTETERRRLMDAYLANESQAEDVLKKRMQDGFLLPADYETFLADFAHVRQLRGASLAIEERARGVMRLSTGQDTPPDDLAPPDLPRIMTNTAAMKSFIRRNHPEVKALQQAAARIDKLPGLLTFSGIGANLNVSYSPTSDNPGTTGDSYALSLSVNVPIDILDARKAAERQARALSRKARNVVNLRREQLLSQLRTALAGRKASLDSLHYGLFRLVAAMEACHAARLRLRSLSGNTFEQFLRARQGLLIAALDALDAQAQALQAQASVLRVTTDAGGSVPGVRDNATRLSKLATLEDQVLPALALELPDSAAGSPAAIVSDAPPPGAPVSLSAYVWDASRLLAARSRDAELRRMQRAGISELLVSLTSRQLKAARRSSARALRDLVAQAHRDGLRVSWLLGDPDWILPKYRSDLVSLVRYFKTVPFDGLHLDLEPDQLPNAANRQAQLANELAATAAAVKALSPWKVALSLNPRYLSPHGPAPELAAKLRAAGISEVTLMVYSSDRERVLRTVRTIAEAHPNLFLSLAQSFEADQPPATSFHSQGGEAFRLWLVTLKKDLAGYIHSIRIQSWKDYRMAIQ